MERDQKAEFRALQSEYYAFLDRDSTNPGGISSDIESKLRPIGYWPPPSSDMGCGGGFGNRWGAMPDCDRVWRGSATNSLSGSNRYRGIGSVFPLGCRVPVVHAGR